jgi:hypothetical protein
MISPVKITKYTVTDLKSIDEYTEFMVVFEMSKELITESTIAYIDPAGIKNLIDHDQPNGIPITRFILSNITEKNLENIKLMTARYLLVKRPTVKEDLTEEAAAERFTHILIENRSLLKTIRPDILVMFLGMASSKYAPQIAKLISTDAFLTLDPSVICILIRSHTEAALFLMRRVNGDNLTDLDPSIKIAFQEAVSDPWNEYLKKAPYTKCSIGQFLELQINVGNTSHWDRIS